AKLWGPTGTAGLEAARSRLPAERTRPPAQAPATRPGSAITVDESQKKTSVFDTLKREGRWTLPDEYRLTSWMGDIYLDAREAVVDRPRTHVQLDLWAATAKILLPPGVSVAVAGNRPWSDLKIDEGKYEICGGPHLDFAINGFMATAQVKMLAAGERIPKTWKWF